MSSNDIHGIEPGWTVKTLGGDSIGSVEETTDRYILVKSGLLNAAHRYLPAATLEHVRPELHEIAVSLTQEELESRDWSRPPAEGPRTEGAPLNADAYIETDEAGPAAEPTVAPERPPTI